MGAYHKLKIIACSWVPILQVGGLENIKVNCFPKAISRWHGRESNPRPPGCPCSWYWQDGCVPGAERTNLHFQRATDFTVLSYNTPENCRGVVSHSLIEAMPSPPV
ncbi:hypothetical protein ElyMa_000221900 [Elysia marginata]|uniref:Uncharacterized protein n=1 Tax=Elysia marginata TaxID=1093978 RepID=A0AAV4F0H3_9GAST|nr:hypothetical protein ElyMa_000221900 [Elysia marginata]